MGLFSGKKCVFAAQALLLACVFTALLCSRGEGLQLLPFPDAEANPERIVSIEAGDNCPAHTDAERAENSDSIHRVKHLTGDSQSAAVSRDRMGPSKCSGFIKGPAPNLSAWQYTKTNLITHPAAGLLRSSCLDGSPRLRAKHFSECFADDFNLGQLNLIGGRI